MISNFYDFCTNGKKTEVVGDSEWFLSILNERCIQDALNEYLAEYPYVDGFTLSQADVKIYRALNNLKKDFSRQPHLRRWFNHVKTFSDQEKSGFRVENGQILPRFTCISNKKNGGGFQVGLLMT